TLGYALGPASAQIVWRHLPSLEPTPPAAPGTFSADRYDIFDLAAVYKINSNFTVRAGMDNVLDVQPQVTAKNITPGAGVFTTGNGTTLPGIYDVLGRRFYFGVKIDY